MTKEFNKLDKEIKIEILPKRKPKVKMTKTIKYI